MSRYANGLSVMIAVKVSTCNPLNLFKPVIYIICELLYSILRTYLKRVLYCIHCE